MKILTAYSRFIIMKKKLYQQPQTEMSGFQTAMVMLVISEGSGTPPPVPGMPRRGDVIS